MRFKLLLLGFLFFLSFQSFCQYNWFWSNPKPSGYAGIEVIFINPTTGYIINSKEILITEDAGANWRKHRDISNPTDIEFNDAIGFIVGNKGYILKSVDYGKSWSAVNTGTEDDLKSVKVINKDTVILSSSHHIIKSFDGGASWSILEKGFNNINNTLFLNSNVGFLANSDGLFKTKDGGINWYTPSLLGDTYGGFSTIYFVTNKVGFVSRGYNDILKTVDGGENWFEVSGTTDGIYSYSFLNENTGYIAGEHGVIFKTTDGGESWQWAGFQNGRYGGTSIRSLYFIDEATGYAIGNGGRVLKTTDGGLTWQGYSPTYQNISGLYFPTENIGYSLGAVLMKTVDKGNSWEVVETGLKEILKFGHFFSEDTAIVVADEYFDKMLKTVDGGKTWEEIKIHYYQQKISSIFFYNQQIGIVSCTDGPTADGLYKTIDGGKTWHSISSVTFSQIHFINNTVGLALRFGDLYRTTDGGNKWEKIYEVYGDLEKIYFVNEKVGYIAGEFNTVLKTVDGGMNWKELKTPYDHLLTTAFYNENVGFAAGEYGNFFKTQDGGLTWQKQEILLNITSLVPTKDKHLFAAGGGGLIIRDTISFDEVVLTPHPVSMFTDNSAGITGIVASNGEKIESIVIEYWTASNEINTITTTPGHINAMTADSIKVNLSALLPNTTYTYRIKATHKGLEHVSEELTFITLPEVSLNIEYVQNTTSNTAALWGKVISNEDDITSIEFEYGRDSIFSAKVEAIPNIVFGNKTASVKANLIQLKPGTTYYARMKGVHKRKVFYSKAIQFATLPDYQIEVNPPYIDKNTASLRAFVKSNSGPITNIVFEYSKTRDFKAAMEANPNTIVADSPGPVTALLTDLDREAIYFFRVKGLQNNKQIYSDEKMFKINGGLLLSTNQAEDITDSTAVLSGMIAPQGMQVDSIYFECGTTTSYGIIIPVSPPLISGNNTFTLKTQITDLEPNTTFHYRMKVIHNSQLYYSQDVVFKTGSKADINERLTAYPNPTKELLFYYIDVLEEKINKVELYDYFGKSIQIDEGKDNRVNISALPAGIYYFKAYGKKNTYWKKIIKQ